MTPVEKLQAAIEKLEHHVDESWHGFYGVSRGQIEASNPGGARRVSGTLRREDAELIVTLHRTIDAQLAILRFAVKRLEAITTLTGLHLQAHEHEMALADAILGGDS